MQRRRQLIKPDAARLFDAENRRWVESQLVQLPEIVVETAKKDYERTLKRENGLRWANTNLREFVESDAVKNAKCGRAHYDDEEITSAAKIKADSAAKSIETSAAQVPKEYAQLAAVMAAGRAVLAAEVPAPKIKNPDENAAGFVGRVKCVNWWRRVLRKQSSQARDQVIRSIGKVKAGEQIYCADVTVDRRRGQLRKNADILSAVTMENENGYQATLQELAAKSIANPELRRMELMTRIRGLEEFAKKIGYVGEFWTVTAPSKYHRFRADGRRNRDWNKSTPREVNDYVTALWSRVRASLARAGVTYFGIRVVEPHHDGCPHWHMLVFLPEESKDVAREILTHYALEDSPEEQGAQQNRVKCIAIDTERGSAAGYVAKYVSKSINGESLDADEFGNDAKTASQRIAAWASCWRIRQFQFFGSPPVTVWREFRRFDQKLIDIDTALENLRIACDLGQFDKYFELQVMHCAKLITQDSEELNRYGEPKAPEVIGIACENEDSEAFVDVIRHEWRVVGVDVARQRGAWSSVNNCTAAKNERTSKAASAENRAKNNRIKAHPDIQDARPKGDGGRNHH